LTTDPAAASIDPLPRSVDSHQFLQKLEGGYEGLEVNISRYLLSAASPFFEDGTIKDFVDKAVTTQTSELCLNYVGSTTRTFKERCFKEHGNASYGA
jgi:hypothetical protein